MIHESSMFKKIYLVLFVLAFSSHAEQMDDRDIDTACVEDTLERLDVDEAVSSCFKDPLEDSDPKTEGENLKAKLQKLVSDYREANRKANGDKAETDDATETKDAREAEKDGKKEEDVIKSTSENQQLADSTPNDPVPISSRRRRASRRRRRAATRRRRASTRRRHASRRRRRASRRRRSSRRRRNIFRKVARSTRRGIKRIGKGIKRLRSQRRKHGWFRRRTPTRRRTWRRRSYGRPGKPKINGCSIPFKLYFPFKKPFTPYCNEHDTCYYRERYSQKRCDNVFYRSMLKRCKRYGWAKRYLCNKFAGVYYAAVRAAGSNFYG